MRNAILNVYPRSDVRADGQVIKIAFSDGIRFEIVPTFKSIYGGYKYPNTNCGGKWESTNPKAEQEAMAEKNRSSNGCFMILVDIFDIFEIIIFRVIICQVL